MVPGLWYCDLHDLDHTRVIAWQECWIPLCQAHSFKYLFVHLSLVADGWTP